MHSVDIPVDDMHNYPTQMGFKQQEPMLS